MAVRQSCVRTGVENRLYVYTSHPTPGGTVICHPMGLHRQEMQQMLMCLYRGCTHPRSYILYMLTTVRNGVTVLYMYCGTFCGTSELVGNWGSEREFGIYRSSWCNPERLERNRSLRRGRPHARERAQPRAASAARCCGRCRRQTWPFMRLVELECGDDDYRLVIRHQRQLSPQCPRWPCGGEQCSQ